MKMIKATQLCCVLVITKVFVNLLAMGYSGMLVQDPTKKHDVESIFDQARRSGAAERHADTPLTSSNSRSFTGTARLLTGETVPSVEQPPEVVNHTITFWQNGFTIDDGPLRRLDDPENATFLEVNCSDL